MKNRIGKRVKIVYFPMGEGGECAVNPSMVGRLGTITEDDGAHKHPLRVRVDNDDYPNPNGSLFEYSEVRYLNNRKVA